MKLFLLFACVFSSVAPAQIMQQVIASKPQTTGCTLTYTTNLKGWYKADAGLTCTSGCSDGNAVTAVADQSGNGNDLTAATAGIYKVSQINGLPAIRFTAASSQYYTLTGIDLKTATTTGMSMFVVAKGTATGSKYSLISGPSGSLTYWFHGGGKQQGADITTTIQIGSGTASEDTSWHQTSFITSGTTNYEFRIDRGTATTGTFATTITANQTQIGRNTGGANEYFGGDVAEILIYSSAVTAGNLTTVQNYLNCRSAL